MPRISLSTVIAPLLVLITLALGFHKMTADKPEAPPPPNTAAYRESSGAGPAPVQPPATSTQTGG
ncbi:hypothetical protein JMJ56_05610 [Belnapia sp. T18]|uniref:Uncharacterized protein n=1 Tax=Belnapia arida TaxID=2804533 RepID=A0ABS1TYF4_9PROT|nr:hypothetical protein [Belnapia arida]MBL6077476.1 hypothetical protein [Belnapia arida]